MRKMSLIQNANTMELHKLNKKCLKHPNILFLSVPYTIVLYRVNIRFSLIETGLEENTRGITTIVNINKKVN